MRVIDWWSKLSSRFDPTLPGRNTDGSAEQHAGGGGGGGGAAADDELFETVFPKVGDFLEVYSVSQKEWSPAAVGIGPLILVSIFH